MGLQQNASLGIAYDVGEELVMLPDRREALRHTLIFSADDVGHGQRKDALGGFAQGAVEDLVHLAAQAGVRYSIENPRAYVDANILGSFNVMEAARRAGVAVGDVLLSLNARALPPKLDAGELMALLRGNPRYMLSPVDACLWRPKLARQQGVAYAVAGFRSAAAGVEWRRVADTGDVYDGYFVATRVPKAARATAATAASSSGTAAAPTPSTGRRRARRSRTSRSRTGARSGTGASGPASARSSARRWRAATASC